MQYLDNIAFALLLIFGIGFFVKNFQKIIRNIKLGQDVDRKSNPKARWINMAKIALGQSKMVSRPLSGIMHIVVYVGFIVINIELLEIIIDGLFGTHRAFAGLGGLYIFLIATFEILAILVLISVVIFWTRRNVVKLKRFISSDLNGWPKSDANYIIYFEIVLMSLFLLMNATDFNQQLLTPNAFPVSKYIFHQFGSFTFEAAHKLETVFWWLHIVGIIIFLNYLYFSKHLHILLAFPNTYFADLNPPGQLDDLTAVTAEVKLMMGPTADPFAAAPTTDVPKKFGAQDVQDLNWAQLLNAYTCTECGRCTSVCPANLTGKKLSPRKIMMDTRDRLVEVGNNIDKNKGVFVPDNVNLLGNYISAEEVWACTSCNACVQECPVNISPLSIIIDLRRFLVMEQSAAPMPLNAMMTNIENNGAPWQYSQQDRLNWVTEH